MIKINPTLNPNTKLPVTRASVGLRHCLWAVVVASMLCSSCVKRTVTTRKRSYSIVGSGGEEDDSEKMKKRFASGFNIGEDGNMQSEKKELYSDKSFRNTGDNDTTPKLFRSGEKDFSAKKYNTPEYLSRQKYFRTKNSGMDREARESNVDQFTSYNGTDEAYIKTNKAGFLDWLNPFSKKKAYQGEDKSFSTSTNRRSASAISNAPSPKPMSQIGAGPQDQTNTALSMDDVKKILNPGSFGRQNR